MTLIKSLLRKCLHIFLRVFYKILRVEKIYRAALSTEIGAIPSEARYCLVFGALLFPDETITPMLIKRLEMAMEVCRQRPDSLVVLSGDGSKRVSNDCNAMRDYLAKHSDIPADRIIVDPEGFNTEASLRNLKKRIGSEPFIMVTSGYHMPRCAYIAHRLGMKAYALDLPQTEERFMPERIRREKLAMVKSWFTLTFYREGKTGDTGKRLWYGIIWTAAKAASKLLRLKGRTNARYPGALALGYCPYLFDYLTRRVSLTLVTGSTGKSAAARQRVRALTEAGKKVFVAEGEELLLADVAAAMIRHLPLWGKTDLHGVICLREEDFYKFAEHCQSPDVSVYVTDIVEDETVAHKKTHLIRERIRCGCELMPKAKVWLNDACTQTASLKEDLPNDIYAWGD